MYCGLHPVLIQGLPVSAFAANLNGAGFAPPAHPRAPPVPPHKTNTEKSVFTGSPNEQGINYAIVFFFDREFGSSLNFSDCSIAVGSMKRHAVQ
jgi:hypothetical protein